MWLTLTVLLLGVFVVLAYLLESKRLSKKRERFSNRESLSPNEIYQRFYAASGIDAGKVCDLWVKIADILKLDASKLRPTDQFDIELRPAEGHLTEDEIVALNDYFRNECKRKGISIPEQKLKTLDDLIIRLLSGK